MTEIHKLEFSSKAQALVGSLGRLHLLLRLTREWERGGSYSLPGCL